MTEYDYDVSAYNKNAIKTMIDYIAYPKPWRKCFAYLPVTVHGEKVWFKPYYERFNCREDEYGNRHEFVERGTIFDLLKEK